MRNSGIIGHVRGREREREKEGERGGRLREDSEKGEKKLKGIVLGSMQVTASSSGRKWL